PARHSRPCPGSPLLRKRRDGEYARSPAYQAGARKCAARARDGRQREPDRPATHATGTVRRGSTLTSWATMRPSASGTTATRPKSQATRDLPWANEGKITMPLTAPSRTPSIPSSDERGSVARRTQALLQLANCVDGGLPAARIFKPGPATAPRRHN